MEIVLTGCSWLQIDGGKLRVEDGRHSGLFSFIRRNSLGDKKSQADAAVSTVQHTPTTPVKSVVPAVPSEKRQNNDGILLVSY